VDTPTRKNAVFYDVFDFCPVADFFGASGVDVCKIPLNGSYLKLAFAERELDGNKEKASGKPVLL